MGKSKSKATQEEQIKTTMKLSVTYFTFASAWHSALGQEQSTPQLVPPSHKKRVFALFVRDGAEGSL